MSASAEKIRREIARMDEAELLDLIEAITSRLREHGRTRTGRGRLGELFGLGAEVWEGVDPVAYLRQERDAWGQ